MAKIGTQVSEQAGAGAVRCGQRLETIKIYCPAFYNAKAAPMPIHVKRAHKEGFKGAGLTISLTRIEPQKGILFAIADAELANKVSLYIKGFRKRKFINVEKLWSSSPSQRCYLPQSEMTRCSFGGGRISSAVTDPNHHQISPSQRPVHAAADGPEKKSPQLQSTPVPSVFLLFRIKARVDAHCIMQSLPFNQNGHINPLQKG